MSTSVKSGSRPSSESAPQGIGDHERNPEKATSRRHSSTDGSKDAAKEAPPKPTMKKSPNDFIFGKVIGEGSFSTVYLAKEVSSGKEFAIKVLEKKHIIRENKQQYVMREKDVFTKIANHHFFVHLNYTFQDSDRLYFVLSYAEKGELLNYLKSATCFSETCTQFYAAELVQALQYLHGFGIIHRDLKPENVLLDTEMHILITDFGSAKILPTVSKEAGDAVAKGEAVEDPEKKWRTNSFVGTAQYVSPEVLTSKRAYYSSDLWALGCIIYQMLAGLPPFVGAHEFTIFQKIQKLEYDFPDGFGVVARDLVEKLLVIDPAARLGCDEMGGFESLKQHKFFDGISWDTLHTQTPPFITPYLPVLEKECTETAKLNWNEKRVGLDDARIGEIITEVISETERQKRLKDQEKTNKYNRFVEGNLILKQGFIDKKKGLFARRRMFLLTEGPHLYYIEPDKMVLKGEIPWSKELRPEAKNFKIFFVHTPARTYYLEDPEAHCQEWIQKINEVWARYYGERK